MGRERAHPLVVNDYDFLDSTSTTELGFEVFLTSADAQTEYTENVRGLSDLSSRSRCQFE